MFKMLNRNKICLVELGDFILDLFTESTHQAQASRTRGGIHTAPPPHFFEYAFCYSKISFPLDAGMLNRQVAPLPLLNGCYVAIEYIYMLQYVCALCIDEVFLHVQTCLRKTNFQHIYRIKLKNLTIITNSEKR